MRVYRMKIFTITAYSIQNTAPQFGDRRKELAKTVLREECFLSEKHPGILFYFNRNKPHARLWRDGHFKIVRLGRIANIDPADALYTYHVWGGGIKRGYLNLECARLITDAEVCDAESCSSLLVA